MENTEAAQQEHPLSIYFIVWGALFVLSAFSYMVDYLDFQGYMRWFLILLFMWLKAAAIVSIFMHMRWERPALITAILVPPLCLLVLILLMAIDGGYTELTREMFYSLSSVLETTIGSGH
jgi:cytochrome c oxidase subunit IV